MTHGDLASWHGRHAGETIVVCGCGESLNGFDRPERFVTIGVNDVGRRFTPDYLVVVNPKSQFAPERWRHVESTRAKAVFTHLPDFGIDHPQMVRFRLGRYGGTAYDDPGVLHHTKNSPYVAVGLALQMGARRIGLVGVDFTEGHFFGATGAHPLARRLARIDGEYAALASACRARGVELVNLSASSRITALPRRSLDEFTGDSPATAPRPAAKRRVFVVNYRFLACGDVFATGLARAAAELGVAHASAWWDDPSLAARLRAFAPDLMLVVHGRRFAPLWRQLKCEFPGLPSAVWLLDEPYEVDDTARWSGVFDHVFVNDAATLHRHARAQALPTAFDPAMHRDAGAPRDLRVGFIGGANPARERTLLRLADAGLLDCVVGGPWHAPRLRALQHLAKATPEETARLYQRTRIVLNVFRTQHHFNRERIAATAPNPRVFEALACGALVVSEPRPSLAALFPEVPTFGDDDELLNTVRRLLADPAEADARLQASRAGLAAHSYGARLAEVLRTVLGDATTATRPTHPDLPAALPMSPTTVQPSPPVPGGWHAVGHGIATASDGTITLDERSGGEIGLATDARFADVTLSFELRLSLRARFIAKLHHVSAGDRLADSYHLVLAPHGGGLARQHCLFSPVVARRGVWLRVVMSWRSGRLRVTINGAEVARAEDARLAEGHGFVGVTDGRAELRDLVIEAAAAADDSPRPAPAPAAATAVPGFATSGDVRAEGGLLRLQGRSGQAAMLISSAAANDVELSFSVKLEADTHLIAKIHHQSPDDPAANSYHLVSTPTAGYLARHGTVLAPVMLPRRVWQRVRLRWVDQRLELFVDDRCRARLGDNLLQSGHAVIAVDAGGAEIRDLACGEVRAPNAEIAPLPPRRPTASRPMPFMHEPRRNLMYHVWPVRGGQWRWNVEQLLSRIALFDGRRLVSIVHDVRSDPPEAVRRAFEGHGCEFFEARNGPGGETLTFPSMLGALRSLDPEEVTFYAHAKGVKYEPAIPPPVTRWAETLYRVTLDDWPAVRAQLERHAMTGAFKMLGRFRAHRQVGDWHYSGTFFWLRHVAVFARDVCHVPAFYGGVEAWPGIHFRPEETGCLFMDGLRKLPYHEEFWRTDGDPALARWEAGRAKRDNCVP